MLQLIVVSANGIGVLNELGQVSSIVVNCVAVIVESITIVD